MSDLDIGQKAPAFTLPRDGGGSVSLSDFEGRNIVLYFYPKDDTPGCTKEAIGFTERVPEFEAANTVVIGVSRDTVARHEKFRDKHGLGVILASDEDGAVCEAYGVWVEKSLYGRKYMGIERATFLIDAKSRLAQIWRKVKVAGHSDQVLDAARALRGGSETGT
jgi:peroxiredoxin Q/BCP